MALSLRINITSEEFLWNLRWRRFLYGLLLALFVITTACAVAFGFACSSVVGCCGPKDLRSPGLLQLSRAVYLAAQTVTTVGYGASIELNGPWLHLIAVLFSFLGAGLFTLSVSCVFEYVTHRINRGLKTP